MKKKVIGNIEVIGKDICLSGYETPCKQPVCQRMDISTLRLLATCLVRDTDPGNAIHYYADGQRVYIDVPGYYIEEIPGANPNDFHVFKQDSAKFSQSGEHFYYQSTPIPYDPREGERIGGYYVRYLDTLYYGYTDPVVGADAATFTVLQADLVGSVAKDAQHVYYRNHIVTGADPDTFEFLPACVANDRAYYVDCDCTFYAKDQHRAYWVCTTADEIKPINSKSLDCFTFFIDPARRNYGFARDAQYEYNAGKRKALPKT